MYEIAGQAGNDDHFPSSPAPTEDLSYDLLETIFRPSAETTSGTKKIQIADQSSSSTRRWAII